MSFCRGVLEKGLAQIRRCIKHMDFGTVVLMGAVAYGLGLFWYGLILGRSQDTIWRTAAFGRGGCYLFGAGRELLVGCPCGGPGGGLAPWRALRRGGL